MTDPQDPAATAAADATSPEATATRPQWHPFAPKNIVVSGNVVDGFEFHGPFNDANTATEWGGREFRNESWCLGKLHLPNLDEPESDKPIVAVFSHKHGVVVSLFRTRAGAEQRRTDLASEGWEKEFPNEPEPPEEQIGERYFAKSRYESFDIYSAHVETD
jgi:hypothetical protein